jgi:hypothetical protein
LLSCQGPWRQPPVVGGRQGIPAAGNEKARFPAAKSVNSFPTKDDQELPGLYCLVRKRILGLVLT